MSDPLSSDVPRINLDDFNLNCGSLKNKSTVSVVLFYSPSCSFCRQIVPEYTDFLYQVQNSLKNVSVLAMNISDGTNNQIISYSSNSGFPYQVLGVPFIVIFSNGEPCSVYNGVRTSGAMFSFVSNILNSMTCPLLDNWKRC